MKGLRHPEVHPFAGFDVPRLVEMRARTRADHPFVIWAPFEGEPETWTYAGFRDRVRRVAAGLHKRGVKTGDKVLVHLDNCPETILAWYACAELGAVAVTTNARSAADELAYFAEHSGAVGAITQPKFAELVNAAHKGARFLVVTGHDNGTPAANAPKVDGFAGLDGDPASLPGLPVDPWRPVGIQYTSGTTSRPKGVVWTNANALWGAKVNAIHQDLKPSDTHLCFLPLFHTNAQAYSVLSTLWMGGTCVVQPRFSASRFWDTALKYKCTWLSLIPFCVRALMDYELPKQHHFRLWGSAICEPPTDAHFGVKTIGWWGMTETMTHGIIGEAHQPNRPLAIGKPADEYGIAITRDDGSLVEAGETGNLLVKGVPGLSLFLEYLNNPGATADSFDEQGWFKTGDTVTLHEDGFISFADRSKDMLKVGGENVAASEIERVIMLVPGVREVAVVARKHPMLDEVPVAFVRPDAGAAKSLAEDVAAACARALADFKRPREVRLVEDFPRSTLEKIAKNQLRAQLTEEDQRAR
ncbi:AMP-binding protein [Desertibaculum subflavum]|uniref:AMP-binding protein n=1 Tax=Desertibaculum subflavum TaxID=2268458 RepID=UPI000E6631B3